MNMHPPELLKMESDEAGREPGTFLQLFVAAKALGPPYAESSRLLTSILSQPSEHSAAFWEEADLFTDALLGKPGCDPSYIHILNTLSDESLQTFLIEIAKHHEKPEDIDVRYSLVVNLCRTFPECIDEYVVLDLLMATGKILLEQAAQKFISYSNKYRDRFVTHLIPLMMSSPKKVELVPYFVSLVPEIFRFYLSCLLNSYPDEDSIFHHPDACWQSLFQIVREVRRLGKQNIMHLWRFSQSSRSDLITWWSGYKGRRSSGVVEPEMDFLLVFSFWTFIVRRYMDVKTETGILGRIPFLLWFSNGSEVLEQPAKRKLQDFDKLKGYLELSAEVWNFLESQYRSRTTHLISLLQLEESSIYATFLCDLGVRDGSPLLPASETYPVWLRTQILTQRIFQNAQQQELTQPVLDDICLLTRNLRLRKISDVAIFDRNSGGPRYVWSDCEIFGGFCDLMIDQLTKQPLDRANDETLSVLLTIIQPVANRWLSVYQHIFVVLAARQKFIFKRFFDYIVLPDMVGEFSGLVGKVVLELQMEVPAVSVPVHKTRGANRETTEALHIEFQRHIAGSHLNSFEAVQKFIRIEKDTIGRALFSASTVLPKRSKVASSQ